MQPQAQFSMETDSFNEPQQAAALAASILSDDDTDIDTGPETVAVPFIKPLPESVFKLPGGGIRDAQGAYHDEVEVRELNGLDEEALSKAEVTKSMARYMQTLVKRGVVRIGSMEPVPDKMLNRLLVGDRETVLLAIRRATYGDEFETTLICPLCGERVKAIYDLATEIPIKTLESGQVLDVTLKSGAVAKVRLPTASDQDMILNLRDKTLAEANTVLLSNCIMSIDGAPGGTITQAQNLSIPDRHKILKEITEGQPGPKYEEVMVDCPECGGKFPSAISLIDLFRG